MTATYRVFIDAQHGLSNRLRAIASAASIAERTGRELVVIWTPDHHCDADMADVLDLDVPVITDRAIADLCHRFAPHRYNYMEIEPGASFGEPVLTDPEAISRGDVYIRSAYTLSGPHVDPALELRFLRRLVPAAPVLELIDTITGRFDVSMHIRVATGGDFDHLPQESPANWPAHRHAELTYWRGLSQPDRFLTRLGALVAAGEAERVFLAADVPATYDQAQALFGSRIVTLPRLLFDRSRRQVQYGFADLLLLTDARRFLASSYSSFSDLAIRLGRPGQRVERSGHDF